MSRGSGIQCPRSQQQMSLLFVPTSPVVKQNADDDHDRSEAAEKRDLVAVDEDRQPDCGGAFRRVTHAETRRIRVRRQCQWQHQYQHHPSSSSRSSSSSTFSLSLGVVIVPQRKDVPRIIHWGGGKSKGPKVESGGGVLGKGKHPSHHQLGGLGVRAPTAQRFPLFSALRMASPDTIMLSFW